MSVPVFDGVFAGVTALLALAALVGALALKLRQPLIVGFIIVGILVGPSGLGWMDTTKRVHFLAELGLAILLFVVGLRLGTGHLRSLGRVVLGLGCAQVVITGAAGYGLALALGFAGVEAFYAAAAVTFSSTIVVVKLLSDKHEAESLHGHMAIGVLIVQDLLVILVMLGLAAHGGEVNAAGIQVLAAVAKGIGLVSALGAVSILVMPRLVGWLARSAEMLVVFAVAWAAAVASVSHALGFSKEVGAFLAGVSLASTPYREMLGARLVGLRDFLVLFFFVDLGAQLDLQLLGPRAWAAAPLALFVLIAKPLIVMAIVGALGYRRRTGFLTGVALGQISEFSLILLAQGQSMQLVGSDLAGLMILVGLITFAVSSYLILNPGPVYDRFWRHVGLFERKARHREEDLDTEPEAAERADVILFGLGRYGTGIAEALSAARRRVLGVDFDPQAVKHWNESGGTAKYGDAEDPEFHTMLPLEHVKWVVSSVRDRQVSLALLQGLRSHAYCGNVALTAADADEAAELKKAGADAVFDPYADAATQAAELLPLIEAQEDRQKMDSLIAKMRDHYVICGYGRMGQQIVKDFRHSGLPHVVIEWNPEQIPKLRDSNVPHVEGRATEEAVLIEAGIKRAKGLISVLATDEENVFIVLSARGLNSKLFILARSILEENEGKLRRAGADRVMSPYILGGRRMAAAVIKPRAMDFLDLVIHSEDCDLEIGDLTVAESSDLAGKSLRESRIREECGATVLAIRRQDGQMRPNPSPDEVIAPGDELIVMGSCAQIDAVERLASGSER